MAYNGQAGGVSPFATPNQTENAYAIAKALLGQNQGKMQSWLQPMAQMANAAVAAKYLNSARGGENALTQGLSAPQGPGGPMPSGAPAAPAATPGAMPGATPGAPTYNPFLQFALQGGGGGQ